MAAWMEPRRFLLVCGQDMYVCIYGVLRVCLHGADGCE